MNITRENYESFFLDYLEGSLDSSLMEEMHAFLERNPDLKAEMEEFEQVSLPADPILFEEKERLKKVVSPREDMGKQHLDHLFIAKLEGDLSSDQEKALDQLLLEQPKRKIELDLYLKTKLKPVPVIFPDKLLLKRKTSVIRRRPLWYSISVAASIILILLFSLFLDRFRYPEEERIADIVPATESNDATDSEKAAVREREFPASVDQQDLEQAVNREEYETVKVVDHVAMTIAEPLTQEKAGLSGNYTETVDNGRTELAALSRRDYIPINTAINITVTIPETNDGASGVEEEYLTFRALVTRRLKRAISAEEPGETGRDDRVTFLDIAEAGVRGVNRISGSDMKLDRYYDQNGELTSFAFTSRNLSFSHEVKK